MRPLDNFPKRYANVTLPTSGEWFEAAKTAHGLLAAGGIVGLWGPRGAGKTFMAYDLAQHGAFPDDLRGTEHPRPAIYRTAMEIFLEIRDTWRHDATTSEIELLASWRRAALLVIDELQERGETDFENQKLTHLIDTRYRDARPTLLIGNFETQADFEESLSDSIVSRMAETGGLIRCDWPSFRQP